ncbi:glycerophosphodiester phosphodiesterase family protein [Pseudofrankia sp. BMG5.37]|uniref:glycerophosphodiester phosphodiesterase family protein n=1 Tax=Pseudofrankia sp. BMG5.37 TaxID=3050035 RepID=UPI002895CDD4|nr:glycerophosphodiester phosphodiesterase family protein [Pseudofrankia sp. BMG5.37]MDT3445162.1 glycerophosphodiester phosphodiesterase family protein [Pseudofrankia sp. BMG5.37]
MSRHRFLDHPGPIPLAHRGGAGPWPENSWPAFENAVALGYRYLETDVRVTRDGTAMVLHDSTLERVADRPGRLADLPLAEASRVRLRRPSITPTTSETPSSSPSAPGQAVPHLSSASPSGGSAVDRAQAGGPAGNPTDNPGADRIGGAEVRSKSAWASSDEGEPIPRLDELLDRWPEVRLNLDVKEPAALEPMLAALRRANALDRVCVTSFDDAVAREARRLAGPGLCVGAGLSAIAVARLCSVLPPWLSLARRGWRRPAGGSGSLRLNGDRGDNGDAHGHGVSQAGPRANSVLDAETRDDARPAVVRSEDLACAAAGQRGDMSNRDASNGDAALVPAQATGATNRQPRRPRGLIGRDVVQVPVAFRALPVCDARFVRYMNTLGLPVHVWTVNDEASMSMLLELGVDGIITDRPELLRDVLRRHNLWSTA